MKRICQLFALVAVICALGATSCSKVVFTYEGPDPLEMIIGQIKFVPYNVEPADVMISWSSSNPNVATVEDGCIAGVSVGNAVITGRTNGASIKFNVKVKDIPVESFSMPSSKKVFVGIEAELEVFDFVPSTCNAKRLEFTSSDNDVVSVWVNDDATVSLKGLKMGTATITASCEDVSRTCTVTVSDGEYFVMDCGESFSMYKGVQKSIAAVQNPRVYDGYEWTSADPDICRIIQIKDDKAEIVAVGTGKTTISCTVGPKKCQTEVTVMAPEIILTKSFSGDAIFYGDKPTFTAEVMPCLIQNDLKWTVSDSSVADFSGTTDGKSSVTLVPKDKSGSVTITVSSASKGLSQSCKLDVIGTDLTAYIGFTTAEPTFKSTETCDYNRSYCYYPIYLEEFYLSRSTNVQTSTDYMSLFDDYGKHLRSEILKKVTWSSNASVTKTAEGYSYVRQTSAYVNPTDVEIKAFINDWCIATMTIHYGYSSIRLYSYDPSIEKSKRAGNSSDSWFDVTDTPGLKKKAETSTTVSNYAGEFKPGTGFVRFTVTESTKYRMIGVTEMPTGKVACSLLGRKFDSYTTSLKGYLAVSPSHNETYYYQNGNSHTILSGTDKVNTFSTPSVTESLSGVDGSFTFGCQTFRTYFDVKNVN